MSRKHLDLTDRCIIEKGLALECSFCEIAANLDCSPSTVMREVKNNCIFADAKDTICAEYTECLHRKFCGNFTRFFFVKGAKVTTVKPFARSMRRLNVSVLTARRMCATAAKNAIIEEKCTRIISQTERIKRTAKRFLKRVKITYFR